jgi:hypothetical protein
MKAKFPVITSVAWAAISPGRLCPAIAGEIEAARSDRSAVDPKFLVACTGWHALCSGSADCQLTADGAACEALGSDPLPQ